MTLVGALNNAIQGLNGESANLGIIADNISNSQTVGYKDNVKRFENLIGGPDISPSNYVEAGVKIKPENRVTAQGVLQAQTSNTALGVNGNGFFAVTSGVNTSSDTIASGATTGVTRAGDFTANKYGYLVNTAGYYLLGVPATTTAAGNLSTGTLPTALTDLTPVQVLPNATTTGIATTSIKVTANLPATDAVGAAARTVGLNIYDSAGNSYDLSLNFTKTAANTWSLSSASAVSTDPTANPITAKVTTTATTLSFDSQGNLTSPTSAVSPVSIALSSGETLTPTIALSTSTAGAGLTQLDDTFATTNISQNGAGPGAANGLSFDSGTGVLYQTFTNNTRTPVALIPLVTYQNPYGLDQQSGNLYTATTASGTVNIDAVNTNGAGRIQGNALEASTTDISKQFTDLIVSQTNYAADSKMVNATDQMYKTVYTEKSS